MVAALPTLPFGTIASRSSGISSMVCIRLMLSTEPVPRGRDEIAHPERAEHRQQHVPGQVAERALQGHADRQACRARGGQRRRVDTPALFSTITASTALSMP